MRYWLAASPRRVALVLIVAVALGVVLRAWLSENGFSRGSLIFLGVFGAVYAVVMMVWLKRSGLAQDTRHLSSGQREEYWTALNNGGPVTDPVVATALLRITPAVQARRFADRRGRWLYVPFAVLGTSQLLRGLAGGDVSDIVLGAVALTLWTSLFLAYPRFRQRQIERAAATQAAAQKLIDG